MKKFLNLTLVLTIIVLLVSSCNSSTKATTAVTTSDETTTSTTETTTETAVETTVESTLNYYKIDSTEPTIETKETVKKKTTTTKSTTTETAVATIVVNNRQVTGDGGSLPFQAGETVLGAAIQINGKTFPNCVIKNAPMEGIVISGVIWPWEEEIGNLTLVSNDEILAPVSTSPTEATTAPTATPTETTTVAKTRTPTGSGQSLTFQAGDTIVGWSITVNGKTYEGGVVLYNSPYAGTVIDGVINPWTSEITTQTVISP